MSKFWFVLLIMLLTTFSCKAEILPTATEFRTWTTSTRHKSMITQAANLEPREVDSICGSWSTWISGSWQSLWSSGLQAEQVLTMVANTISCAKGVPCVFEKVYSGLARGYCSSSGAQVITSAYDYGQGPSGTAGGCTAGQLCCEAVSPAYGVYVFDNAASTFTTCGTTRFWQPATGTLVAVTTSVSSPSPSPAASEASVKLSTGQIIGIVFGGVSALGAIISTGIAIHRFRKKKKESSRQRQLPNNTVGFPLSGFPAGSNIHINVHGNVYLTGQNGTITDAVLDRQTRLTIAAKPTNKSSLRIREIGP